MALNDSGLVSRLMMAIKTKQNANSDLREYQEVVLQHHRTHSLLRHLYTVETVALIVCASVAEHAEQYR